MPHGSAPNYLDPDVPPSLRRVVAPVIDASEESLGGYGFLVDRPEQVEIEIVRWPSQGWRPVDDDCGDQGGTTQGYFTSEWKGDILYGRNDAVDGHYILGYAVDPPNAVEGHDRSPERILLWHANYHPDGGQLFFPQEQRSFFVPLAKPGDDIKPEDFVCFRFDGSRGLYIHPGIWHDGVFARQGSLRFFDKQGAVHARVSVDFAREFGCLLDVGLGEASDK